MTHAHRAPQPATTHHAAPVPHSNAGTRPGPAGEPAVSAASACGDRQPVGTVWPTAQAAPATQRKGRYTPESTAHPAKMLPAIAAHAIATYTTPGELVFDPMCGIGTTLVEAVHQNRRALGVEYEPRWAAVTEANLDLARHAGCAVDARVLTGDARRLSHLVPAHYRGQVALIVTSPPYGRSTHGQVRTAPNGVHKSDYRYGDTLDRANLANLSLQRLLTGFTSILAACVPLLRPGGHVVLTVRPWREHCELVDLPSHILGCGRVAGLAPTERCVALLARLIPDGLVTRGSFFQRDLVRKHRQAGLLLHLVAHEDVLVFEHRPEAASSEKPKSSALPGQVRLPTETEMADQ